MIKLAIDFGSSMTKIYRADTNSGIVLAEPFFRKKDNGNNAVFKFACVYGNMGYMALPLCQSLLGSEGVFYCSAGVVAFNILSFAISISNILGILIPVCNSLL